MPCNKQNDVNPPGAVAGGAAISEPRPRLRGHLPYLSPSLLPLGTATYVHTSIQHEVSLPDET